MIMNGQHSCRRTGLNPAKLRPGHKFLNIFFITTSGCLNQSIAHTLINRQPSMFSTAGCTTSRSRTVFRFLYPSPSHTMPNL